MIFGVVKKIISGGQTGADRAALDVALAESIPCGGWCPKGRKAEDGTIDAKYPLRETKDKNYETRTRLNVQEGNATLILFQKRFDEGTRLTKKLAEESGKPVLAIDLINNMKDNLKEVVSWLQKQQPEILNIAGPRESNSPGIYKAAYEFLKELVMVI